MNSENIPEQAKTNLFCETQWPWPPLFVFTELANSTGISNTMKYGGGVLYLCPCFHQVTLMSLGENSILWNSVITEFHKMEYGGGGLI